MTEDKFEKELINEIDGIKKHGWLGPDNMAEVFTEYLAKYRAFKFEHTPIPSDKPAKDLQGQHAQMVALAKAHGLDIAADWAVKMSGKTFSDEILSKYPTAPTCHHAAPSQEPLAVLAARKGCFIHRIIEYPDRWVINLDAHQGTLINNAQLEVLSRPYVGETYASVEKEARAYLERLPDAKGEGR